VLSCCVGSLKRFAEQGCGLACWVCWVCGLAGGQPGAGGGVLGSVPGKLRTCKASLAPALMHSKHTEHTWFTMMYTATLTPCFTPLLYPYLLPCP
jgi:hypothetical protein